MSKKKKMRVNNQPDSPPKVGLSGRVDQYTAVLLLAIIGIIPLLVRARVTDFTSPRIVSSLLNSGLQGDFFSYYKWTFLIAGAVLAVCLLLYKILAGHYEIRPSYINVPLFILVLCLLLSLLTAEYKSIALVGLYSQREGTLTYLCYLALFFVAANTVLKPWFARWTCMALGIFTFINTIIILFDFYGHNLAQYKWAKDLLVPIGLQAYINGHIVSTLSNPNYVSGLSAALFVFFLSYMLLHNNWQKRIFSGLAALAAFSMLLASLSSSGFITLLLVSPLVVAAACLTSERKQTLIMAGTVLLLCSGVFYIMNAYNPSVSSQAINFIPKILSVDNAVPKAQLAMNSPMPINNVYSPPGYNASPNRTSLVSRGARMVLANDAIVLPPANTSAGSGRTYIWQETLKLIKKKPILGYGLDTLSYYFPQSDINMIANMQTYNIVITKPHNFYLAIAYGAGVPALLVLLALFLLHFYHSGRRLLTAPRDNSLVFPTALFLFCCAFAVQWLFNDSVVGSSPIFWILLGAGVSLNRG